jgi:dolichol-phosphate mannosyltransferase
MDWKKLTIIIPTLNEGGSIGKLLIKLEVLYPGAKIIVSDDGSKDNTQEIVRKFKGAYLLDRRNKKSKGLTASVVDAVKLVNTSYIVVMDGDIQHPPEKVGDIAERLSDYPIVVGTRRSVVGDWGFFRKLMSRTAILLGKIRLMGRVKCKDIVSGFFGVRTTLFKYLVNHHESSFEGGGYKVLFDLLKMVKRGTKLGSVKYDFMIREKDQSKIGKKQIFLYLKSLFK